MKNKPDPNPPVPSPSGSHPLPTAGWVAYLKELYRRFNADQCPVMAAALTFFTLLSAVPILLMGVWVLSMVVGAHTHEATEHIMRMVSKMLPGETARTSFKTLMAQVDLYGFIHGLKHAGWKAGVIGSLGLIWAAMQIFVNASTSLNAAFEVTEKRSWIKLRLVALGILIVVLALFALSMAATAGVDVLHAFGVNAGWNWAPSWTTDVALMILALLLNTAMFGVIYHFLPNARVASRDAAVGGISVAILWVLATRLMSAFLSAPNKMYGALSGVVVLITWCYYTNMLLLAGAEVAAMSAQRRDNRVAGNAMDKAANGRAELGEVNQGSGHESEQQP